MPAKMTRTFDDLKVRRAELAKSYIGLLNAQPGRPIAMFAPRRVGKTYFLDNDLAPAAEQAGMLPVYADLWANKSDPLDAINHALEEALDDALVPKSRAGKIGRTSVKKLGLLGASIDMGEAPARRALPVAPRMRLDALVARLSQATGKPILLMLDEVQTLADAPDGEGIISAVRAVLHKRREVLKSVFTGSNQEGLARMLSTAGAPMYQFAQMLDFPTLGDEYLEQLADHFASVHSGKKPAMDALRQLYARIGFKPGLIKDVVKAMSAEGVTNVDVGVKQFLLAQSALFEALLQPFERFDRSVLRAIAHGLPPTGRAMLEVLESLQHGKPTLAKVRASLERLRRAGILAKPLGSPVMIDDALLAEYLRGSPA